MRKIPLVALALSAATLGAVWVRAQTTTPPAAASAGDVEQVKEPVRLELYRDERHASSDFLSLYRFPEGWKIVAKTFHAWPRQ